VRAQIGDVHSVEHRAGTLFSGYYLLLFNEPKQGFGGLCKLAISSRFGNDARITYSLCCSALFFS